MSIRSAPIVASLCLAIVAGSGLALSVHAQTDVGTLCTRVYFDGNLNGFFDPGESLIAGAIVSLEGESLTHPATYTTGVVNVPECVGALAPGLYIVSVQTPNGMVFTSPGQIQIGVKAGEKLIVEVGVTDNQSAAKSAICATIYENKNGNETREQNEGTVSGGLLVVYDIGAGSLIGVHQTDGNEPYCIYGLWEGEYHVVSGLPPGWSPTTRQAWKFSLRENSTANLEFGARRSEAAGPTANTEGPPPWPIVPALVISVTVPLLSLAFSAATLILSILILGRLRTRQSQQKDTT